MIGSILIVGCGNMGGAMLDGWLAAGLPPEGFVVADPVKAEAPPGVRLLPHVPTDGRFDAVLLAVKPQLVGEVAPAVARIADERTLLLSVLAGTTLESLARLVPRPDDKVRVMPNLAAAFGKSPVALVANRRLDAARAGEIAALLAPLGTVEWLADEDLLHAVTALGGSGPGFVYRFLAALVEGAAALGLDRAAAARMAVATVAGAAELAAHSGEDFAALAAKVASKGGTTEAGMAVLDGDDALAKLVAGTLRAASERSRELARQG